jgi:hypothetical protein
MLSRPFVVPLSEGGIGWRQYIRGRRPYPQIRCGISSLGAKIVGRHLAGTLVLNELVGDLLTIPEIAHAGTLDCADVDENVLAAVIRLNESETLGRIEPLDCARAHDEPLCKTWWGRAKKLTHPFSNSSRKVVSERIVMRGAKSFGLKFDDGYMSA